MKSYTAGSTVSDFAEIVVETVTSSLPRDQQIGADECCKGLVGVTFRLARTAAYMDLWARNPEVYLDMVGKAQSESQERKRRIRIAKSRGKY